VPPGHTFLQRLGEGAYGQVSLAQRTKASTPRSTTGRAVTPAACGSGGDGSCNDNGSDEDEGDGSSSSNNNNNHINNNNGDSTICISDNSGSKTCSIITSTSSPSSNDNSDGSSGSCSSLTAVKRMKWSTDKRGGVPSNMLREVSLLKQLQHRNVVLMTEAQVFQGSLYLMFDYLPYDLQRLLKVSERKWSE
jgi:hypothetical protein